MRNGANNTKDAKDPKTPFYKITSMWIFLGIALGAGILQLILQLLKSNGLQLLNQAFYYTVTGTIYCGVILAVLMVIRHKLSSKKNSYIRRMITILAAVMISSVVMTLFSWSGYLPYHYATMEHNDTKVAIMCHYTIDAEVTERLNAASEQYMIDAEAAAAEAQAAGESIEEVPNTVTGVELLNSYAAYPIKYKFFYDENANVEGRVYTLFGATSAVLKLDWPDDNTCYLYVEGVEGEGSSTTTLN